MASVASSCTTCHKPFVHCKCTQSRIVQHVAPPNTVSLQPATSNVTTDRESQILTVINSLQTSMRRIEPRLTEIETEGADSITTDDIEAGAIDFSHSVSSKSESQYSTDSEVSVAI